MERTVAGNGEETTGGKTRGGCVPSHRMVTWELDLMMRFVFFSFFFLFLSLSKKSCLYDMFYLCAYLYAWSVLWINTS